MSRGGVSPGALTPRVWRRKGGCETSTPALVRNDAVRRGDRRAVLQHCPHRTHLLLGDGQRLLDRGRLHAAPCTVNSRAISVITVGCSSRRRPRASSSSLSAPGAGQSIVTAWR